MIKKAVLKILLAILAVVVLCFVWAPAGYVAKDLLGFGCQQPMSEAEENELQGYLPNAESTEKILALAETMSPGTEDVQEISEIQVEKTGNQVLTGTVNRSTENRVYFEYKVPPAEVIIAYVDGEAAEITVYRQDKDCLYQKTETEAFKWTHFRYGRNLPWETD